MPYDILHTSLVLHFQTIIRDSVHYGYLTKSITTILDSPSAQFSDPRSLRGAITNAAFDIASEAVVEVCVRVGIPKMVLLASNSAVECTVELSSTVSFRHRRADKAKISRY